MKTYSADYGVDLVSEKKCWYRWHRFPLLPIFSYRSSNKWNTSNFSFSWLNLRVWSMDSLTLLIEFVIEDVGVRLRFHLFYLNIHIWLIPFPIKWHQKLWRKSKGRLGLE